MAKTSHSVGVQGHKLESAAEARHRACCLWDTGRLERQREVQRERRREGNNDDSIHSSLCSSLSLTRILIPIALGTVQSVAQQQQCLSRWRAWRRLSGQRYKVSSMW